jgi:hypothetical protein
MPLYEDVAMRTLDFAPLYRSTVGFDQLFDMLEQSARSDFRRRTESILRRRRYISWRTRRDDDEDPPPAPAARIPWSELSSIGTRPKPPNLECLPLDRDFVRPGFSRARAATFPKRTAGIDD